ncbi:HD domain-containing protein [Iamia majanohamensis]|uniref:HD domain-containing protein n=1 Tax=Iamia majanohamensis TaxID=467976 RepID=A0AAF0BXR7_9ACTN|nr:HD domain-containing protein [Iamia majanohamensis]WCO69084.1 HD domain-containing protein [Iamia majanohamensis]
MSRAAASSVDEVLDLYARWGDEPYDEALSQSSHAAQVAAWAEAEGAPDHLVAAALLHDVGHLLAMEAAGHGRPDAEADRRHEAVGARWLAAVLPPGVTAPIALHVQAKRYRCAVEPGAEAALSAGSRASLVRQGGPMAPDAAERFAARPGAADALRLRTWDDAGKVLDAEPVPVASHRALLERLVRHPS